LVTRWQQSLDQHAQPQPAPIGLEDARAQWGYLVGGGRQPISPVVLGLITGWATKNWADSSNEPRGRARREGK
jgi:hypothetical protein